MTNFSRKFRAKSPLKSFPPVIGNFLRIFGAGKTSKKKRATDYGDDKEWKKKWQKDNMV